MTTSRLARLCFDANEPSRLAEFWASALGWELTEEVAVRATDGTRFGLVCRPVAEPKAAKNPIHLDLVAESPEHQRGIVDRMIGLGAAAVDVGQGPDAEHVVLADPEGNELCVVLRGEFLADTGFVGAVVFEPANPVTGYFWGRAIGWPVVYDHDGDVAIRAPDGAGPFITFGPPAAGPRNPSRLHLELAADDLPSEVDRLAALGARRIEGDVVLADPDGNQFRVLGPGTAATTSASNGSST